VWGLTVVVPKIQTVACRSSAPCQSSGQLDPSATNENSLSKIICVNTKGIYDERDARQSSSFAVSPTAVAGSGIEIEAQHDQHPKCAELNCLD
jgi:hypothetical protein